MTAPRLFTIEPLKWELGKFTHGYCAKSTDRLYLATQLDSGQWTVYQSKPIRFWDCIAEQCFTLDEAKAAAQAHHEQQLAPFLREVFPENT